MKKYLSRFIAALLALVLLAAPASALTVDQALELLEDSFYYDIPDGAYEAQTLDELITLLGDPYTQYMTEEQYAAFLDAVEDTVDLVGIGVEITYTEDGFLLKQAFDGGPAQEAGLAPGDLIVAVDGVSCAPATSDHRQLMLGDEGTKVTITVLRSGQTRDYTLTRRAVYIPNTQFTLLEDGVGYVDCNSFGLDTDELFAEGLKEYDSQVDCWLVDLRGNGGGYVDSALEMAAAVDGPGRYLYFEDHNGETSAYACRSSQLTRKPLILLVDGDSASASELFAANVRDSERGILVGSRTYGKGVAQSTLDQSSDPEYFEGDCLKVTTARFYSASGSTTDRVGVIPTLLVEDGYTEAVALALTGGSPETSSLCVMANATPFYVDPDTPEDVLAVLLESLPPQILLFYNDGVFAPHTPAHTASKMGLSYNSRWFSDVDGSPYAEAINAMGTYELLNGTAPGQFSPKQQLTRAQLCVMLARALNVTATRLDQFSDVDFDAWYADGVNAMAELGLVNGVGGGRFDPEGILTTEEFLTIMGRTARYLNFALDEYGEEVENPGTQLPLGMQLGLAPFSDWAYSSVAVLAWGLEDALYGHGDMLYTSLRDIAPSAPVLREEATAGMYAVLAGLDILPS